MLRAARADHALGGDLGRVALGRFEIDGRGRATAAYSRNIDQISYPQYLLVFPMFLFCGVFYPIESLPRGLQWFAWVLPLTSVNSLFRTLTLGLPIQYRVFPIIAAWLVALVWLARRSMFRRLVK